jgi:uncharacterized protein YndB with AHSA1/START domain
MSESTDRIEKSVFLKAPRSRVWRALSNAEEFGNWFGVKLKGKDFVTGQRMEGQLTFEGYEHVVFEIWIERMEPEHAFSYRWHPYALDSAVDYSQEPTTLVEFALKEAEGGTLLTVVESGFDKIPLSRRPLSFRMNSQGWEGQMKRIQKYVEAA